MTDYKYTHLFMITVFISWINVCIRLMLKKGRNLRHNFEYTVMEVELFLSHCFDFSIFGLWWCNINSRIWGDPVTFTIFNVWITDIKVIKYPLCILHVENISTGVTKFTYKRLLNFLTKITDYKCTNLFTDNAFTFNSTHRICNVIFSN